MGKNTWEEDYLNNKPKTTFSEHFMHALGYITTATIKTIVYLPREGLLRLAENSLQKKYDLEKTNRR